MAIKSRKQYRRFRIKQRIRKIVTGTPERPRFTVFRSNKEIYAQIVDDLGGKMTKIKQAEAVGKEIASKAKEAGIESVVFDRNGYLYHGRVKSLAESARKEGLKF